MHNYSQIALIANEYAISRKIIVSFYILKCYRNLFIKRQYSMSCLYRQQSLLNDFQYANCRVLGVFIFKSSLSLLSSRSSRQQIWSLFHFSFSGSLQSGQIFEIVSCYQMLPNLSGLYPTPFLEMHFLLWRKENLLPISWWTCFY